MWKVWDKKHKIQFVTVILSLVLLSSTASLAYAVMFSLFKHGKISKTAWDVGFNVCFSCWVLGGSSDYIIAFKYLKSAFGIVNRKILGKIRILELTSISVFLIVFLTT